MANGPTTVEFDPKQVVRVSRRERLFHAEAADGMVRRELSGTHRDFWTLCLLSGF
jgi:hypothetical protein